jgi:transcriptional regulator with XRE-family HTH domain
MTPYFIRPIILTLTHERKLRGYTKRSLSFAIGVKPDRVGLWESGHSVPDVINLVTWAEVLGYKLTLTPMDNPCPLIPSSSRKR